MSKKILGARVALTFLDGSTPKKLAQSKVESVFDYSIDMEQRIWLVP